MMSDVRSNAPSRRSLLRTGGMLLASAALAGCYERAPTGPTPITPSTTETGPGGSVYVPTHVHERLFGGATTSGGYRFGLAFSVPDYHWEVSGAQTRLVEPADDDNLQLLVYVWEPGSGRVLPGVQLAGTVEKNGRTVAEPSLTPTLSQRWGYYYVANLSLQQYGDHTLNLAVEDHPTRRGASFGTTFSSPTRAELGFDFDRGQVDSIQTTYPPKAEARGAVPVQPAGGRPIARPPEPADRPGRVVASGRSADARLEVAALDADETPLADDRPYLALFATTPYNRLTLPRVGVVGTLSAGDGTVFEGRLEPTIDPDLGYHYGAGVSSAVAGGTLSLSLPTPPQVARREGFEEAFVELPDVELAV